MPRRSSFSLWEPRQLFQAGFQLSFFVVLCIILILPALRELGRRLTAPDPLLPDELRPRWRQDPARAGASILGDLSLTSLAAWIGSLPLVAYYFHIVTPVSTPANVLAVPLCALVLISNLASLLLAGWFPAAAELFNHAGWFLMECIRVCSHWFAHWPGAYFYVPAPALFTTGLYYAILLGVLTGWLFQPRLRAWKIAALAIGRVPLGLAVLAGALRDAPDHPARSTAAWRSTSTPRARRTICWLIAARPTPCSPSPNRSFARKASTACRPCSSPTATCATSAAPNWSPISSRSRSSASARSASARPFTGGFSRTTARTPEKLRTVSRNDQLGRWTVLHPDPGDRFSQADDNALVLSAVIGGQRILLLSDLGRPGQDALLQRTPDLRADIVVTGLPVQPEALGDALLDAIQPRLIIVADSEFPAAERASPKLRERLARRRVPVIYTRTAGAATIEWRGHDWELRTMSGIRISSRNPAPLSEPLPEKPSETEPITEEP